MSNARRSPEDLTPLETALIEDLQHHARMALTSHLRLCEGCSARVDLLIKLGCDAELIDAYLAAADE